MHSRLGRLQPYPFERLRALLAGIDLPASRPIRLSIGEPQHATPDLVRSALTDHLAGLSTYPATAGLETLREAMAAWFVRRFNLPHLDPATQVLPVSGTREALFAIAQAVVDTSRPSPAVVSPNPFYQIYEGAALLAGAEPLFLNQTAGNDFDLDLESLTPDEWRRTQLVYVCSPGNPTGHVLDIDGWRTLFEYADRYGFVIASDECYSEIYPDETAPPIGALEAARALGRDTFHNLVVFTSLSKRSNAPGLRSGGIAGDAALLKQFLLYRTYHGCAMSLPVQHASIAAWGDESHVRGNRGQYRAKFDAVVPMLDAVLDIRRPDASFYLWAVADMAANSGNNAMSRDPEFTADFLRRHQDKLLFGSDCGCADGHGGGVSQGNNPAAARMAGKCVARETLTLLRRSTSPEVFRKIVWDNAHGLLRIPA